MNEMESYSKRIMTETDFYWNLLSKLNEKDRIEQENLLIRQLNEADRKEMEDIQGGRKLAPLSSDIIAKKIFDADENTKRLQFLLQRIAKDLSIKIDKSYKNEGYIVSTSSKKVVFDEPALLKDGRLSNLEFQVAAQEFVFTRGDIYVSNMLLLQYSVETPETPKRSMDYDKVKGVLLVILMKDSPKIFKEYQSEHYIHRFITRTADSGLSYKTTQTVIYVQLDKCLQQFKNGTDGEKDKELQTLLSMIADINDPDVSAVARKNAFFSDIYKEVANMSKNKEVQTMILAEKFAEADWNAVKAHERNDGIQQGIQQGIRQERINMLVDFLASGASELDAKKIFHVTDEDIREAREAKY